MLLTRIHQMMATKETPAEAFRSMVTSPVKFRLFLLSRLPMAYLAGLRISSLTDERATVTIPYKYFTKNPFRSIYFACLSMAAELSTGVLCMMHVYKSVPAVSMLVVSMEADFTRKAVGVIRFSCQDGRRIQQAAEQAKATGEGQIVTVTSTGIDETGAQVASFRFTWSFKAKRQV